MAFIAKNPMIAPEIQTNPPTPMSGTRGLFPKSDGWYDIDDSGTVKKIGSGGGDSSAATVVTIDSISDWDALDTDEKIFGLLDISPDGGWGFDDAVISSGDFRDGYHSPITAGGRIEIFFYSAPYFENWLDNVLDIIQFFIISGAMYSRIVSKSGSVYTYSSFWLLTNYASKNMFSSGNSAPTHSTSAPNVGAIYVNTTDDTVYHCTDIRFVGNNPVHTWEKIAYADEVANVDDYFKVVPYMPPSSPSPVGGIVIDKSGSWGGNIYICNSYDTEHGSSYTRLISPNDYATSMSAGVVKVNNLNGSAMDATGFIKGTTISYSDYSGSAPDTAFISKGTLQNVIQAELKPLILQYSDMTGYTLDMLQRYNHDIRFTTIPLTILQIQFSDGVYALDYIMSFNFNSGTTPTDIVYANTGTELQISTIINWVGTDCGLQNGVSTFTPQANKHYEVMIWFNGTDFTGKVMGYEQANSNVSA